MSGKVTVSLSPCESNVCFADIYLVWARMPRYEKKFYKDGSSEIVPLKDRNTRINMPMLRFRERKGTIAGSDREGTANIMAGLLNFYHNEGFDPVASGNSVKRFWRDLKRWEVMEVKSGNTARFGGRAGSRAVDDETRKENHQKMLKSIENGKKRAAKSAGAAGRKLQADEDVSSQACSPGVQKRRRRGQDVDAGFAPWDEQYARQQEFSTFEGGQSAYTSQGNRHHRHQD